MQKLGFWESLKLFLLLYQDGRKIFVLYEMFKDEKFDELAKPAFDDLKKALPGEDRKNAAKKLRDLWRAG